MKTYLKTTICEFNRIEPSALYDIMALREEVFTLEQKCSIADFDGLDKLAKHVWTDEGEEVFAVARILPPDVYKKGVVSFGRVAVKKSYRGKGYGKSITDTIVYHIAEHYPNIPIEFSAQLYLKRFYESLGFKAYGEVFDEAGIPHIKMGSDPKTHRDYGQSG